MGHQAIGGYNAEDDEANARAALAAARVSHEAEERQQLGATWWARIGQTVGLSVRAAGPEHTRNLPSGGQGGGPAVASLKRPLLTPRHCVRRCARKATRSCTWRFDWDRGRRHGAAAHLLRPRH